MHGGVKFYRGSPSAARTYVEADRARVDDYYLAEGTGLAAHHVVTVTDGAAALTMAGELDGSTYELWVAGHDVHTGEPKGRLRKDGNALRFVEVVVNGPKTWSLAASLHPQIAAAYDAAQDRAAQEIIGWLAEHTTTRVGPRGRQVQVPVEKLEAAVVRHHTSRAGDPHRHLHLQINARVYAAGAWRGLHSVGVVDSLNAVNGIGHAAVMCDPDFRQTLAAHGYHLDPATGEIAELAPYAGPFSARAAQITRHVNRYEAAWRAEHPGQEPGATLRRAWDRRAWAQARPDKVVPLDGQELTRRWTQELHDLGFTAPQPSFANPQSVGAPIGLLDRDAGVDLALTRLGARRSAWNAADIRGEVEQIIAAADTVAVPAARRELAEDLVARGIAASVPLVDRDDVPEHVRSLTSQQVLDVEDALIRRLAARGQTPGFDAIISSSAERTLDAPQRLAARALGGTGSLVVVEGPAGAGKTTTLAAVKDALAWYHQQLVIVTPTLKAARVAEQQVGVLARSAGSLIHQYGFRWDTDGHWQRVGRSTGGVRLLPGDLLLVDEAGMLDQDTALALLTIADETGARLALVGDRHQLPAVGRGGVLDLAERWAHPSSRLELDTVHRFADPGYADLSLLMRTGERAGSVFDALVSRGDVVIHATEVERDAALATADGLIIADTRDQVRTLNAAIRDARTAPPADPTATPPDGAIEGGTLADTPGGTLAGTPGGTLGGTPGGTLGGTHRAAPDTKVLRRTVTTAAGEDLGAGDLIATRRNDRDLDVANRDTWTVTSIGTDGALQVRGSHGRRTLPADYARTHVELAYATTVHGAQGQTVDTAHLAIGDGTGAASAYVGMTRGRHRNVAHLVAPDLAQAREHWIRVFARDRADLGPRHAATLAVNDIETYGPSSPRPRRPEPTSYSKPKPSRGVPR